MRWRRMFLAIGAAAASLAAASAAERVQAAGCCATPSAAWHPSTRPAARLATKDGAETYLVVLRVTGRTCAACDRAIERALRRVEGVRSVRAEGETVTVVAARAVPASRLVEAVERAGGARHPFRAFVAGCGDKGDTCARRRERE